MRDPKRIDEMLELLSAYWKRNPDLRLGQIISNFAREHIQDDSFYMEDEVLIDALREVNK